MLRNALGFILGITVSFVSIYIYEMILHLVVPTMDDPRKLSLNSEEFIANFSTSIMLLELVVHFVSTFLGAYTMLRILKTPEKNFVIVLVSLIALVAAIDMYLFDHPGWIILTDLCMYPFAGYCAWRIILNRV